MSCVYIWGLSGLLIAGNATPFLFLHQWLSLCESQMTSEKDRKIDIITRGTVEEVGLQRLQGLAHTLDSSHELFDRRSVGVHTFHRSRL